METTCAGSTSTDEEQQ